MGVVRKKYPASLKAKVAAEAISGYSTLAQISSKYGIHPSVISKWKGEGMDTLISLFSQSGSGTRKEGASERSRLLKRFAKNEVEIDFLKSRLEILESRRKP
jgi:transposase-like protein